MNCKPITTKPHLHAAPCFAWTFPIEIRGEMFQRRKKNVIHVWCVFFLTFGREVIFFEVHFFFRIFFHIFCTGRTNGTHTHTHLIGTDVLQRFIPQVTAGDVVFS